MSLSTHLFFQYINLSNSRVGKLALRFGHSDAGVASVLLSSSFFKPPNKRTAVVYHNLIDYADIDLKVIVVAPYGKVF